MKAFFNKRGPEEQKQPEPAKIPEIFINKK
jgi:hypothetical protein